MGGPHCQRKTTARVLHHQMLVVHKQKSTLDGVRPACSCYVFSVGSNSKDRRTVWGGVGDFFQR